MEEEILRQFNGDKNTKEAFKTFMLSVIDQMALDKVYKGDHVGGFKDAKEILEETFNQLEIVYGIKEKTAKQDISTSR